MAVDKKVLKTCVVCKRKFLGWFSEKYCSDDCRIEGTRLKNRNRQRKGRKVLDLREGAISQQLGELGLGDTQYPMYNHELVTTMYANVSLYHGRDGKRHVRSYYDLLYASPFSKSTAPERRTGPMYSLYNSVHPS